MTGDRGDRQLIKMLKTEVECRCEGTLDVIAS